MIAAFEQGASGVASKSTPRGRPRRAGRRGGSANTRRPVDPTGGRLRRARESIHDGPHGLAWYFDLSRRPLQMLIFLAPFIALYALGTWQYGTDPETGEVITISAYRRLIDFFAIFGVTGLYLPGAALVVVLLVWHVLLRDRWEVHFGVPVLMWVESFLLTIPLLVLDQILTRRTSMPRAAGSTELLALMSAGPITEFPWQTRLVLSIGAGLYEELLFRMVAIALVHFVLVDLGRMKDRTGTMAAVFIAAVAFTLYHDLSTGAVGTVGGGGASVDPYLVLFYMLSGLYFGALFVMRGFGIAVGVHAVYDIFVIVLIPALQSAPANP